MAILSDYVAGTITLTNGSAAFTGTGTAWQTAQFREGDTILDIEGGDFRTAVIASITGEGSGTLTRAWTGPSVVNAGYRMRYMSDGSRSSAQARALINLLNTQAQLTFPGHLYRLILSNNVGDPNSDIDISAGSATDESGEAHMHLLAGITKRLDASWMVGAGNGGLDTGAKASNTTYHVWLIRRPDTDVVDALFSTSPTNPIMPANYTQKRRIGSILTDDAGNIRAFRQVGGWFHWYTPGLDLSLSGTVGTSATNNPLRVPTGIKVLADFGITAQAPSANQSLGICDPDLGNAQIDDHVLILPLAPNYSGSVLQCWTNTSGQISIRSSVASSTAFIRTRGWYDLRDMSF